MDLVSPPAWAPPWLNALLFAIGCAMAAAFAWMPFGMWRMARRLRRIERRLLRAADREARTDFHPAGRAKRIEPSLQRS